MLPILARLTVVVGVVVGVVDVLEPLEPPLLTGALMPGRGVNARGRLNPAVNPEDVNVPIVAAKSRVRALFASITITSTTTSDLGRSRSCTSFSAKAT